MCDKLSWMSDYFCVRLQLWGVQVVFGGLESGLASLYFVCDVTEHKA